MEALTNHAKYRCRRRGIGNARLAAILNNADIDLPAGRGCRLVRVSRSAAAPIKNGESLLAVGLIVSADGMIVTAKHCTKRRLSWRFCSGRGRYSSSRWTHR